MADLVEQRESPPPFKAEVFDRSPEAWGRVKDQILPMTEEGVGWTEDTPMLGQTDDVMVASNIEAAFTSSDSTAVLLRDRRGDLLGYSLSVPFEKMDPQGAVGKPKSAYIYFTVLDKDHRGQGLVGKITDPLFEELSKQGYEKVVRDSMIGNGYAAKVAKHYTDSIDEAIDHEYWPEVGPQTRFTIDINKYLEQQFQIAKSQE